MTLPDESTVTFTPTLTFPEIVSRDLRETGGNHCSMTVPGTAPDGLFAAGGDADGWALPVVAPLPSGVWDGFAGLLSSGGVARATGDWGFGVAGATGCSILSGAFGPGCKLWFEYFDPARITIATIPNTAAIMAYRANGFFLGGGGTGSKRAAISGTVQRR
jgi:hypothetical protein